MSQKLRKRILVVGYFGYITNQIDGQTIKTCEIYRLLCERSLCEVDYFDSQTFQSNPLKLFTLLRRVRKADIVVYLPGQRNLTFVFDLIWAVRRKNTKFIYPVVGGWLAEFLKGKSRIIKRLKQFSLIGVESKALEKKLKQCFGLNNVEVLTNFRATPYHPHTNDFNGTLRIVFMARITRTKGCDTIFDIADRLDCEQIDNISISFFGAIDPNYRQRFFEKLARHSPRCSYGGVISPDKVHATLNSYDLLLLPTFYEGEGFPGTIVDAYKAGIPVIVSNWKDLPEFVVPGKTGYVMELDDNERLYKLLLEILNNSSHLAMMKKCAYRESSLYSADAGWKVLSKYV